MKENEMESLNEAAENAADVRNVPGCLEPVQYPGKLCFRILPDGMMDWNKDLLGGRDIFRLHLELESNWLDEDSREETQRVLKSYGNLNYGETISRDIILPTGTPLFALHYIIQRLFGWQNSHMHQFLLADEWMNRLTGDCVKNWRDLVGVLFQSPLMDESEKYWNEDYDDLETGSIHKWLRSRYTGPCVSSCEGESLRQCKEDMKQIDWTKPVMVQWANDEDGNEYVCDAAVVSENETPQTGSDVRSEILPLCEAPLDALRFVMPEYTGALLERLPVDKVLMLGERRLFNLKLFRKMFELPMEGMETAQIRNFISNTGEGSDGQPKLEPVTDELEYQYDFGDMWTVRITGSWDCEDLVESGRLTQEELDAAIVKLRTTFCPVCIAQDGTSVLDDVGGLDGYVELLRTVNPGKEKTYWKETAKKTGLPESEIRPKQLQFTDKQEAMEWAKSQGWTGKMTANRNLL